jgi:hypothetical protein
LILKDQHDKSYSGQLMECFDLCILWCVDVEYEKHGSNRKCIVYAPEE